MTKKEGSMADWTERTSGEWEAISPEVAEAILKVPAPQRPVVKHLAESYAAAMSAGQWGLTAEPIILSQSGGCIDGQHRLRAITKSGCTIRFFVIRGVDESTFTDMGRAKQRTPGAMLATRGIGDSNVVAAALAWIEFYEYQVNGKWPPRNAPYGARLLALLERWPGVVEAASAARHVKRRAPFVSASIATAAFTMFRAIDREACQAFEIDLAEGSNLPDGDPVLALRSRLIAQSTSKAKLDSAYVLALFVKAWNGRLAGARLHQKAGLRVRTRGDQREAFPRIQAGSLQ